MTPIKPNRPIRVLIAEDHTLMRQGLRQLCEEMGGFMMVAEAESGAQAVALASMTRPDVILMDIVMPDVAECVNRNETPKLIN
jgi:two-component system, NarL family, response regulator DegU